MNATMKNIENVMTELGTQKRTIYRNLKKLGIKGNISNCRTCPLANYLRSKFPQQIDISVGASIASVGPFYYYLNKGQENFVEFFDDGNYPDLEGEWTPRNLQKRI